MIFLKKLYLKEEGKILIVQVLRLRWLDFGSVATIVCIEIVQASLAERRKLLPSVALELVKLWTPLIFFVLVCHNLFW